MLSKDKAQFYLSPSLCILCKQANEVIDHMMHRCSFSIFFGCTICVTLGISWVLRNRVAGFSNMVIGFTRREGIIEGFVVMHCIGRYLVHLDLETKGLLKILRKGNGCGEVLTLLRRCWLQRLSSRDSADFGRL